VTAAYENNVFTLVQSLHDDRGLRGERHWKLRTHDVVLATGMIDRPLLFEGNDRPGIMLSSSVRRLIGEFAVAPAQRLAIYTNNDSAYLTAIKARHAGMDVAAIIDTRAERTADGSYRITGHKWFFSAPQCDAHLVLAQTDGGLSCFFMPRRLPDGTLNGIYIQRLKDKVGNRSNASSEVEFRDAWASLLGEPGRGVPTILEMGTYTRLDCVIGSAGMMRHAVVQAVHHARHRSAFGARLIDQPLMRGVLADLVIESEAATALAMRLARAFESDAPSETTLRRALTSAAKFWVCKRGCELAAEAMEVLGGNGYTEELPLARIMREMPVSKVAELVGETDTRLCRMLFRQVDAAYAQADFSNVCCVGSMR